MTDCRLSPGSAGGHLQQDHPRVCERVRSLLHWREAHSAGGVPRGEEHQQEPRGGAQEQGEEELRAAICPWSDPGKVEADETLD